MTTQHQDSSFWWVRLDPVLVRDPHAKPLRVLAIAKSLSEVTQAVARDYLNHDVRSIERASDVDAVITLSTTPRGAT